MNLKQVLRILLVCIVINSGVIMSAGSFEEIKLVVVEDAPVVRGVEENTAQVLGAVSEQNNQPSVSEEHSVVNQNQVLSVSEPVESEPVVSDIFTPVNASEGLVIQ